MNKQEMEEESKVNEKWQKILKEEGIGRFNEVDSATIKVWDERRKLLEELANNDTATEEFKHGLLQAAQYDGDALYLARDMKEQSFDFVCKTAFALHQTGGLMRVRDRDMFHTFLSQEVKEEKGKHRQVEGNTNATKAHVAQLKGDLDSVLEEIQALEEQHRVLTERKRALRTNFFSLKQSLIIRDSLRAKKTGALQEEIANLEQLEKSLLHAHQPEYDARNEDTHERIEQQKRKTLTDINATYERKFAALQKKNAEKLLQAKQKTKKAFEDYGNLVTKQIESRYKGKLVSMQRELDNETENLTNLQKQITEARGELEARKKLENTLYEMEVKGEAVNRDVTEANAELIRAKQALKKLWVDHPSLLSLSPEVSAVNSSASIRSTRAKETAQAMHGFLNESILPLVELPNEKLCEVYKNASSQLESIVMMDSKQTKKFTC